MNYEQALDYIHSLSRHGWVLGLNRVSRLLARVGNPQNKGKFLHIAGTNGKGSLVQLSGNLLMQAGYKVGKYTSPYVLEFRERFTVNDEMISESDLAAWTARLKPMVDKLEQEGVFITEFEFITVLAFCWFAQMGCDIVCLEVGLGGRFDATNVIPSPVACLMASISLDHTAILGDTVEQIATEKGGILKPGAPAVLYPEMNPEAARVLETIGSQVGAKVFRPDPAALTVLEETPFGSRFALEGKEYTISLAGRHQCFHAQMVLALLPILQQAGFGVTQQDAAKAFAHTHFPGRFQVLCRRPFVVVDGAHNPEGVAGLKEILSHIPCPKKIAAGMLGDKAVEENLKLLAGQSDTLFCLPVDNPRALSPKELAALARPYFARVACFETVEQGLAAALEELEPEEMLLVCGSFFLAGEAVAALDSLLPEGK